MTGEREGIPGYGFKAEATARSPLGLEDLGLLEQTVFFAEEDEEYLRLRAIFWRIRPTRCWTFGTISWGLIRI